MDVSGRGKSVSQISALLQAGLVDPRDLIRDVYAAIAEHDDPALFTQLTRPRAEAEAEAAAARLREGRPLGPLDGVPIAWKDLFDLEGLATTAGSVVLADSPPAARDAAVVSALSRAGMVSVGRVNMSEFAFSGLGINPHYGTPRNPAAKDAARLPGGSSSGSAAAVAAGLVPVAMGTDTGGSIRIPAAFTGTVGFKATRGRYPMQGVFPLATSLDALGPLCRTVTDAAMIDAALCGSISSEARRLAPTEMKLVVAETVMFDDAEPEVVACFEAALGRLARAGASIRRQAFPAFSEIFTLMGRYGALVNAEAFALHRERLSGPEADRIDPRVVARVRLGETISLADYLAVCEARRRLIAEVQEVIGPGETLLCPTLPHVAPLLAPLTEDDDAFFRTNAKTLRNTLIGNFLDFCGLSIPCGRGAADMPVGLMLLAPAGQDLHLLSAGLTVEAALR